MAKSDFNIEEDSYFNPSSVMDNNTFSQGTGINQNNDLKNSSQNSFYDSEYSGFTDFSNVGIDNQNDFIDDSSIVFEENKNLTPVDKLKYKLSIVNKKVVLIIFLAFIAVIVLGLVIYLVVTKNIASYKSEIIVPDVVYLEESSNISVIAQGKKIQKKLLLNLALQMKK